jgi:prophage regulatory protein
MTHAGAGAREQHAADAASALLRMPAVVRCTGLGRSTIYRLMASRQFPLPVKLTGRAVGWRKSDVDRWTDSLPTARP